MKHLHSTFIAISFDSIANPSLSAALTGRVHSSPIAKERHTMSRSLQETLRDLSSSTEHRSQTARLSEVFNDVERALKAGVSRKAVYKALLDDGFTMSFASFENALHRLRKRRRSSATDALPKEASRNASPASTGFRFGQGKVDPNAPVRRNTFEWDSVPKKSSTVKRNSAS